MGALNKDLPCPPFEPASRTVSLTHTQGGRPGKGTPNPVPKVDGRRPCQGQFGPVSVAFVLRLQKV